MLDQARSAARFAAAFYRQRASMRWHGYIRRDPMALLNLRPGRRDPYAIYDQLRTAAPMVPTRLGNWVSARHTICHNILRDRRFGVQAGNPLVGTDEVADLSLLQMNPPAHTRLRRLVAPAFTPKRIAEFRPRIEQTVERLLDEVLSAGEPIDLIAGFAAPLPIAVITDLLGVPDADAAEFARFGATIGSALDGIQSLRHASQLYTADHEIDRIFTELFELRRREPADDLISQLVAAGPAAIRAAEMRPLCSLLLIAGFETTVNLIGNATLALLANPDQWARLREDPTLAGAVVEETLRFDPPVQRTVRVAREEVEIDGLPVRRGQLVVTLIGGANRDPQVFPDPDRFDLHRPAGPDHLAFSGGIHYCVGAPLARLEATIALQALATRLPELRPAGRPTRRNASTIRGLLTFPVTVPAGSPTRHGVRPGG